MSNRVGIIGMGWVGTSVAISTLMAGVADAALVVEIPRYTINMAKENG